MSLSTAWALLTQDHCIFSPSLWFLFFGPLVIHFFVQSHHFLAKADWLDILCCCLPPGLEAPVGQVVLHALRNRQCIDLLCRQYSPQCHATQVLKAGNAAWTCPEMNTAIAWTKKNKQKKTTNKKMIMNTNLFLSNIIITVNRPCFMLTGSTPHWL